MITSMIGGRTLIDQIKIELIGGVDIWIDVWDTTLGRKWLAALNNLLAQDYLLEKNYCFLGFAESNRNGTYICDQINSSISDINAADLDYYINDFFTLENTLQPGPVGDGLPGLQIVQEKFNRLHRYFEELQGVSGNLQKYYQRADPKTRWHIRQLNLLCHEFESWALSWRKRVYAPDWQRPSQLMCWLHAPRFDLDTEDFNLFGIDTLYRPMGGVFVGVNKAVGKHHWEVFQDEGSDSRIDKMITTNMRSQTEAAGDFDIEWSQNTRGHPWMSDKINNFVNWLKINGFDPDDPSLTIGHPQIGQVDLKRSFGTSDYKEIWPMLSKNLDVVAVETSLFRAEYLYHWSDENYVDFMIGGNK